MNSDSMFLTGVLVFIVFAVGLVIMTFVWSADEANRINQMDCSQLWSEIKLKTEMNGSVGDYAFSKWIVKECWT